MNQLSSPWGELHSGFEPSLEESAREAISELGDDANVRRGWGRGAAWQLGMVSGRNICS